MNPQAYCYSQAAEPGSAFYYSIKKLPAVKRDAIVAVQTFYQEVEHIIFHFTDLGVAQARFNWWREEVIKIFEATPSHPASLCLQQHKVNPEKLMMMVAGIEQNLSFLSFSKFEDTVVHFMRSSGEKELLFSEIAEASLDSELIYQAMLIIELTHYIQHLRRYAERDLIFFPEDELKQFQMNRTDFHAYKITPEMKELLKFQRDKVERAYQQIKTALPEYLRVRVEIARVVLKEIAKSDFAVLENFIDITPLRRWWIGY